MEFEFSGRTAANDLRASPLGPSDLHRRHGEQEALLHRQFQYSELVAGRGLYGWLAATGPGRDVVDRKMHVGVDQLLAVFRYRRAEERRLQFGDFLQPFQPHVELILKHDALRKSLRPGDSTRSGRDRAGGCGGSPWL